LTAESIPPERNWRLPANSIYAGGLRLTSGRGIDLIHIKDRYTTEFAIVNAQI
jgi:hypothetical protein